MRILLKTINANTPVNLVNNVPDLSAFGEPSLSILQAAFERGDYEIIPDPEPIVEPVVPNWAGFYDQLIVSQIYNYLLSQTIPHPSISGVMAVMGFAIKYGIDDPANPNKLAAFQASVSAVLMALNAVGLPLSEAMLAEVRGLLDGNGFQSVLLQ